MKKEAKFILVSEIDIPPEYRRADSLVDDNALRNSIEAAGIQEPIVVLSTKNGRYTVIDGTRRLAIAAALDIPKVLCVVDSLPPGMELERYRDRMRYILDDKQQDLFPSQRAELIKKLKAMFSMKNKEVAAYLGVDAGTITNWLALDRYIPEVIRAIDGGVINAHAARALDGMTDEGQAMVWKLHQKEFKTLSGGKFHKFIRGKYDPKSHPQLYVDAYKTLEKLQRKQKVRKTSARAPLSKTEKEILSKDLSLLEVEFEDGKEELKQINAEITAATVPLRAIMRNKDLVKMIPADMLEELKRFEEIYV